MEKSVEKINLTDFQKREILEIYKNGVTEKQDEAHIRREIRSKLNSYRIRYSESQVQLVFDDCKTHVILKDLFSVYENKNFSGLVSNKSDIIDFAKDYIIKQYSEMSLQDLEDRDIIDNIVSRLSKKDFSNIKDEKTIEDMISFLQSKLKFKSDLSKSDAEKLFKEKGRYILFLKMYVENLLQRGKYEVSTKQAEKELTEDSVLQDSIGNYTRKIRARRNLLVTDEEAQELLMSKPIAIGLAEDYIYNPDGTRKIENSLAEDKLLTMYLETRKNRNF